MEKDELRDKLMKLDSTYMRLWGQAPVARDLYETINDNEQVEVYRQVLGMYCIKCGRQIEDNAKFCVFCSAQTEQPGQKIRCGQAAKLKSRSSIEEQAEQKQKYR